MIVSNDLLFGIGSKVFERANSDAEFRELALRDGSAAVEQVIGAPLPDGLKIRFVENDGAAITLGLPPVRTSGELNDYELEAVAGGRVMQGPPPPINPSNLFAPPPGSVPAPTSPTPTQEPVMSISMQPAGYTADTGLGTPTYTITNTGVSSTMNYGMPPTGRP